MMDDFLEGNDVWVPTQRNEGIDLAAKATGNRLGIEPSVENLHRDCSRRGDTNRSIYVGIGTSTNQFELFETRELPLHNLEAY